MYQLSRLARKSRISFSFAKTMPSSRLFLSAYGKSETSISNEPRRHPKQSKMPITPRYSFRVRVAVKRAENSYSLSGGIFSLVFIAGGDVFSTDGVTEYISN